MIGVALLSSFTSVADAATLFAPGTLTWGIYGTHIYRINTAKVDTTCSGCGTYNGSTYAGFTNDYFNNNKTYVTTLDYPVGSGIASNGAPTLIPSGAVRMFSFTSYTAINSGDTLATDIARYQPAAVNYDNETWSETPSAEQADPAYYEFLVSTLATNNHLVTMTGPSPDLADNATLNPKGENLCINKSPSTCNLATVTYYTNPDASAFQSTNAQLKDFLNWGFPNFSALAPSAVMNVTLQGFVPSINTTSYGNKNSDPYNPSGYIPDFTAAVRYAVAEVRASAHPSTKVIAELTVRADAISSDPAVTLTQLKDAIESTICKVDGYYLYVPDENTAGETDNATMAADLLSWFEQNKNTNIVCK